MRNSNKSNLTFIYWFAYYNLDSPSVRYRGKYPLDYLKNQYDINSYFIIPSYKPKQVLKFMQAYISALLFRKKNSIIVVQRLNTNWIYATALMLLVKLRNKDTFYDLDDADYLENSAKSIFYFIRKCSGVSVGSNELERYLSKYNRNIFLNTSPTPELNIIKKKKNSLFTIGWIGDFGGGHKDSLLMYFFPALENIPFKVKLILLGVGRKSEYDFLIEYFTNFDNVLF